MPELKNNRLVTKYLPLLLASFVSSFFVILLHRIEINAILPFGFIVTLIFLCSVSILIRVMFNVSYLKLFGIFAVISVGILSELLSLNDHYFILFNGLGGEKPYISTLVIATFVLSGLIPIIVSYLPAKIFISNKMENVIFDDELALIAKNVFDVYKKLNIYNANHSDYETKEDDTPVTQFDKKIQSAIIKYINETFPSDVIIAEEDGYSKSPDQMPKRVWIIDPIDGTKNFVRNVPVWATLIALQIDGKLTKSLVIAPELNRIWWASGGKSYVVIDKKRVLKLSTSNTTSVNESFISISSPSAFVDCGSDFLDRYNKLIKNCKRIRGFGDFYSYMLLAQGGVDIATEPDLQIYDIAALIPIIEGAGGIITDLNGVEWHNSHFKMHSALSCANKMLYDSVKSL